MDTIKIHNDVIIEKEREKWVDITKVMSTILIVFQHSLSPVWSTVEAGGLFWNIINAIFVVSKCGVPLFFMCSGYTMLRKERTLKSIIRSCVNLLMVYLIWMLIYGIYDAIRLLSGGDGIRVAFNVVIKSILFGYYHVWFIFALVGLYLLTPVFYSVMQDKEKGKYVVILSLIATFIIPLITNTGLMHRFEYTLGAFDISYLSGYLAYYLLGMYLGAYVGVSRVRTGLCTVIFYILFIGVTYIAATKGVRGNFVYESLYLIGEGIICTLVYITVKDVKLNPAHRVSNIISYLVKLGFSIYMMHPMILLLLDGMPEKLCVLKALLVYCISVVIASAIQLLKRFRIFQFL